jgi:glycosyltransferase involved in cell wall biosynthesis
MREVNERKSCLALVPPGDPGALDAKIGELLENQWMREALAQSARSYAETFGVTWAADQTLAVYKELLD